MDALQSIAAGLVSYANEQGYSLEIPTAVASSYLADATAYSKDLEEYEQAISSIYQEIVDNTDVVLSYVPALTALPDLVNDLTSDVDALISDIATQLPTPLPTVDIQQAEDDITDFVEYVSGLNYFDAVYGNASELWDSYGNETTARFFINMTNSVLNDLLNSTVPVVFNESYFQNLSDGIVNHFDSADFNDTLADFFNATEQFIDGLNRTELIERFGNISIVESLLNVTSNMTFNLTDIIDDIKAFTVITSGMSLPTTLPTDSTSSASPSSSVTAAAAEDDGNTASVGQKESSVASSNSPFAGLATLALIVPGIFILLL
ncbi:hypothetical protein CANCADRAFT_113111 [Tortispora caseinolytica NRRL Y-17796]|uniref:Uncharacterized protein n=1 Tax=Tortispora caseinolytica NRRL Y-17796 TaxID=767744 RepID=A0A1E4TGK5_9ASCO|nr:hypothetical protein CANCADRAFT_113111 [Tortispora caseinolytica NRRL Y-17796]